MTPAGDLTPGTVTAGHGHLTAPPSPHKPGSIRRGSGSRDFGG